MKRLLLFMLLIATLVACSRNNPTAEINPDPADRFVKSYTVTERAQMLSGGGGVFYDTFPGSMIKLTTDSILLSEQRAFIGWSIDSSRYRCSGDSLFESLLSGARYGTDSIVIQGSKWDGPFQYYVRQVWR